MTMGFAELMETPQSPGSPWHGSPSGTCPEAAVTKKRLFPKGLSVCPPGALTPSPVTICKAQIAAAALSAPSPRTRAGDAASPALRAA